MQLLAAVRAEESRAYAEKLAPEMLRHLPRAVAIRCRLSGYLQFMRMNDLRQQAIREISSLRDDRRTSWVYLVPLGMIFSVFVGVLEGPDGDPKLQAALLLGLASIAMTICWIWARRLFKLQIEVVDYVKGTTTSRMMLWFWVIFASSSFGAEALGVGSKSFTPLWESSLLAFGGVGSILLTVGPAYKEYREARASRQRV